MNSQREVWEGSGRRPPLLSTGFRHLDAGLRTRWIALLALPFLTWLKEGERRDPCEPQVLIGETGLVGRIRWKNTSEACGDVHERRQSRYPGWGVWVMRRDSPGCDTEPWRASRAAPGRRGLRAAAGAPGDIPQQVRRGHSGAWAVVPGERGRK